MSKKLSLLAVLVFWVHYSYSESITPYYGYTGNAAANGHSWNMDSVFPDPPGLDVNAIIYNYTINKQVQDSVTVHVQNENANGSGYIFRETDQWKPGSLGGTQINKAVPVIPNIPREFWGDGSIVTEGDGYVTEPSVIYSYRVDPCYDPQFDPSCPGYQTPLPPVIETVVPYDAMSDEQVAAVLEEKAEEVYEEAKEAEEEELAKKKEKEEKEAKRRLEAALAAVQNSEIFANAFAQSRILTAMDLAVGMHQSYSQVNIDGGTYNETVVLDGGNIPDNKNGRRLNYASDKLHDQMVDMQY